MKAARAESRRKLAEATAMAQAHTFSAPPPPPIFPPMDSLTMSRQGRQGSQFCPAPELMAALGLDEEAGHDMRFSPPKASEKA